MIFALIVGLVVSIVVTVLLCVKVLPAKFDGTFAKKGLQKLHDYFNFKKLYLETILKVLFTFLSITSVVGGVLIATVGNILQVISNIVRAAKYEYLDYYLERFGDWVLPQIGRNFLIGLALVVLAPIVLRLVYETIIMFILLVKNVIDINNKLKPVENKPVDGE